MLTQEELIYYYYSKHTRRMRICWHCGKSLGRKEVLRSKNFTCPYCRKNLLNNRRNLCIEYAKLECKKNKCIIVHKKFSNNLPIHFWKRHYYYEDGDMLPDDFDRLDFVPRFGWDIKKSVKYVSDKELEKIHTRDKI